MLPIVFSLLNKAQKKKNVRGEKYELQYLLTFANSLEKIKISFPQKFSHKRREKKLKLSIVSRGHGNQRCACKHFFFFWALVFQVTGDSVDIKDDNINH